ncbi:uncharacterized protein KNAG_0F03100 [Huiozyma naganishii CBS 8797]|uniref:Uncharacterized protein n=1 Tax=Huiozyma naganishii (strain ATCC MYA-139 / BCRC 22969 / CBS 8797 / KCTC 17520 / NBRC 10181 / NCYC 3082 / Yp74L-3) TaxID=1071383 RepID=J7S0G1_HUIN7|nr:hypothetical protein KNAG_0F03100 [Kazachstania naganishii CBS 8797]CCK70972.1 hypothetical protein KNAG_0F03100 [Kazachstania naganishii CBS 8797]
MSVKGRTSFNEVISKTHAIYKPERGRYWIYGALGCPFSQRVMLARSVKGLNSVIGLTVAHWLMGPNGWQFVQGDGKLVGNKAYRYDGGIESTEENNSGKFGDITDDTERLFVDGTPDPHYGVRSIRELYKMSDPEYSGVFSVPLLFDLKTNTIVNNDSGEIIRLLNSGIFDEFVNTETPVDLAPNDLLSELDEFNKWCQQGINSGVYKINNSTFQEEYETKSTELFDALDKVEAKLAAIYKELESRHCQDGKDEILSKFYLFANHITEADIRLYVTIIRFDSIYAQHFNCNWRSIRADYRFIHLWLRNLYWNHDSFRLTTNFDHIKLFYARSFRKTKPTGQIPMGPEFDILKL